MNYVLLLGAGFSFNWGGWLASEAFEYLLGVPALDAWCRQLLWRHKREGFEAALSAVQASGGQSLSLMEDAVRKMFADMNKGFFRQGFEFEFASPPQSGANNIKEFLARFDAIFSLNQDLLLEIGYCQAEPRQAFSQRWSAVEFPGTVTRVQPQPLSPAGIWVGTRHPSRVDSIAPTNSHTQPIYKLHGSSNWVDDTGQNLLVMGGNKTASIRGSHLLTMYAAEFLRLLRQPNTRLMVIGYGFGDNHINAALEDAAAVGGLQTFIIDPWGADAPDPEKSRQNIIKPAGPQKKIQETLIGASRRGLRQIFGGDVIERDKVLRFFEA
jgi:hypothetical protein